MKRLFFLLTGIIISFQVIGQSTVRFHPPLDIPLVLSGNFGELRSNHFHSGLDFKTGGVSGLPVYAIESGYVSRINIQPGGYGKALYIAHPGGFTSVYGHLSGFKEEIENYIKSVQYERQGHAVNVYPDPGSLTVTKGEVIALSGNTGSSTGPHLHFEVRRTSDQHPLNALLLGFPVEDSIPPVISKLALYPIGDASHVQNSRSVYITPVIPGAQGYKPQKANPYKASGKIGIGVEVFDLLNGAGNRCGVYSIEMIIDGQQWYYSEMDEFSFGETRFINAHVDFATRYRSNDRIQQLFMKPYNDLSIYKQVENGGYLQVRDTVEHLVTIRVTDSHGNKSEMDFTLKGSPASRIIAAGTEHAGPTLPFNAESSFTDKNLRLSFPAFSFYDDVPFNYARTQGNETLLSDIFHIHDPSVPLHKSYNLELALHEIPADLHPYLCLVELGEGGAISFAGGQSEDGIYRAQPRAFGRFALALDSVGPQIAPLNLHPGKDMTNLPAMRFKIEDELSGIAAYNGFIDGEWVLFEYDPKNDLLVYEFDDRVSKSGKIHELEIVLKDARGNSTTFRTDFFL